MCPWVRWSRWRSGWVIFRNSRRSRHRSDVLIDKDIFEDLFVLEMANNHLGSVERGLKIIQEFAQVVRFNNVRASIKLQFRDVGNFVNKAFLNSSERYIAKTLRSALTDDEYATLVKAIRQAGCIPTATPFDERSVDLRVDVG